MSKGGVDVGSNGVAKRILRAIIVSFSLLEGSKL